MNRLQTLPALGGSLLLAASTAFATPASEPAPETRLRVTPRFPWARGLGQAPRIPLVADVDGDGYADLLSLWPRGKCWLEVALNGQGQKSLPPRRVLSDFGQDCIAATTADVDGTPGDEVIALYRDGTVRLARGFRDRRPEQSVIGAFNRKDGERAWLHFAPVWKEQVALIAAFPDGDVETTLWERKDGTLRKIRSVTARQAISPAAEELLFHRGFECGNCGAYRMLAWKSAGRVYNLRLDLPSGAWQRLREGETDQRFWWESRLLRYPLNAHPEAFYDLRNLGWSRPSTLLAGDINGDGFPDFVRFRGDDEPHAGGDVQVQLTYLVGDLSEWRADVAKRFEDPDSDGLTDEEEYDLGTDPLRRDTDNDGLLDGWEVKGFGGTDFPALGCSPRHADVLVRVQRVADVDETRMRAELERARAYYAALPVANPDGRPGIQLHVLYDTPIPKEKANRGWWAVGDEFFSDALRGMWHWKLVYRGGGGQAGMLEDRGSAGDSALYATFIHEFGHQLGLSHEGFWPGGWCPAYPSLMNYAYSYQLGGRPDAIGYSDGKLAGIPFRETELSEVLPLKHADVAFLAGPPYRWRLKADGDRTLVDWNWNGVFGEEKVRADINYGYSTTAGTRQILMPPGRFDDQERTGHAPFLLTHAKQLWLFYVEAPKDAPADEKLSLEERQKAQPLPGKVVVRIQRPGSREWSPRRYVSGALATGDPYAVSHAGRLWLFTPTPAGVQILRLGGSGAASGAPFLLPESTGAQVSALSWKNRLLLFFWRGPEREVTWAEWDGKSAPRELSLGLRSTFPPGPCADPVKDQLLLGCGQDQDERRKSRWIVRRFSAGAGKGSLQLTPAGTQWVMGENGQARGTRRPILLFETGPQVGKAGRLHFLATGVVDQNSRKSCYYNCMTVADPTVNSGWLQRRYYDEWTESSSAVAACWYEGDIALASRWYGVANREFRDNGVYVAYRGLGIQDEPMGDHNDIAFIRNRGLAHSILYFGRTRTR